jgi:integration host factor subunit alpha
VKSFWSVWNGSIKENYPMTLTKDHLINSISNHLVIPKNKSSALFQSILETIKETLENGEDVLISGFGKFRINSKNERRWRNLQTGEAMKLRSRRVITFSCSKKLKEKINRKDWEDKGRV